MALTVQKFGGTSLNGIARMERAAELMLRERGRGNEVVAVLSAQSGHTDELLGRAHEASDIPFPRELDALLSTGEQSAAALCAMVLRRIGASAVSLTGRQAGILTDDNYTDAKILEIDTDRIRRELDSGKIVLAAGFQGSDADGNITTLGRGGSDTSAAALAAALGAERCMIYTDVDGVYTADPRIVPEAGKLKRVSYAEMSELARCGAKVLHPRAAELAEEKHLKMEILSSFTDADGTEICGESSDMPVVGLVLKDECISVVGAGASECAEIVYGKLRETGLHPKQIGTGALSLRFSVPPEETEKALVTAHRAIFT